ncbi:PilZ domain-containing protein [Parasphingorhabdus sp.]|uniref:PilZ domain-containing protein n=1 Tax=Parasphingorhabdus sp. TaxID=2709688 RepID=UPI003593B3A6
MSFESFSPDSFAISERDASLLESKRREARQRVLLRAQLHLVEQQEDVHVTDLSRSGLRGKSDIDLSVGQTVFISLDGITHCSGTVRWIQERRFGLKFCKLLDALPTDSQTDLGHMPGHQERMPRKITDMQAKISLSSWSCRAQIRNISQSGMMLETEQLLTADQQFLVNLSDGRILAADIKWVEGDRIGVHMASPVSILQSRFRVSR